MYPLGTYFYILLLCNLDIFLYFLYLIYIFLFIFLYFPIFNIQKACPWNVQVDKDLLDFTWTGLKEQEIVNTRAN